MIIWLSHNLQVSIISITRHVGGHGLYNAVDVGLLSRGTWGYSSWSAEEVRHACLDYNAN